MICCARSVHRSTDRLSKHATVVLDHADYTALARQHELDHTDNTDYADNTDQESICPERSRS